MNRRLPIALVFGFAAIVAGAAQPVFADAPTFNCPPPMKHRVVMHVHHHWVHKYVAHAVYREAWSPACGSVAHPCNVDHLVVPEQ